MKKLITALLIFLSLGVNAKNSNLSETAKDATEVAYKDSKSAISTVYGDGKDVVKYLTPKTEKLLDKISVKLETTTNEVWRILVRQQKVWSFAYLLGFITSLIFWYRFYLSFKYAEANLQSDGTWAVQNGLLTIALFAISLILSIISISHTIPMLTGFFNSEYGALQTIAEIAKSLK